MLRPLPGWLARLVPLRWRRQTAVLGGRRWWIADPHETSHRQADAQRDALVRLCAELEPRPGEDQVRFVARALRYLERTGTLPELVALFLLPVGLGERWWTPEVARRITVELGQLTGWRASFQVQELAARFIFCFIEAVQAQYRVSAGQADVGA